MAPRKFITKDGSEVEILGVLRWVVLPEHLRSSHRTPRPLFFASEFEIVEHIVLNTNAFYQCFGIMISEALGKRRAGWSFTVLTCVNREAFGLDPKLKPGDIDILIVPKKGDRFYASRSVAIEVKVLRWLCSR